MACSVLHDSACTCSYSAAPAASSGDVAASSGDLVASIMDPWVGRGGGAVCAGRSGRFFLADIFMVPPIAQATIILNTVLTAVVWISNYYELKRITK